MRSEMGGLRRGSFVRPWPGLLILVLLLAGSAVAFSVMQQADDAVRRAWFEIGEIEKQRVEAGRPYKEFLRVPSMSAGLYVLEPGVLDRQQPHRQDEIYYVLSGRGSIEVDGESRPVSAGSIIFVKANVEHRFHDIEEKIEVLVVFASSPA